MNDKRRRGRKEEKQKNKDLSPTLKTNFNKTDISHEPKYQNLNIEIPTIDKPRKRKKFIRKKNSRKAAKKSNLNKSGSRLYSPNVTYDQISTSKLNESSLLLESFQSNNSPKRSYTPSKRMQKLIGIDFDKISRKSGYMQPTYSIKAKKTEKIDNKTPNRDNDINLPLKPKKNEYKKMSKKSKKLANRYVSMYSQEYIRANSIKKIEDIINGASRRKKRMERIMSSVSRRGSKSRSVRRINKKSNYHKEEQDASPIIRRKSRKRASPQKSELKTQKKFQKFEKEKNNENLNKQDEITIRNSNIDDSNASSNVEKKIISAKSKKSYRLRFKPGCSSTYSNNSSMISSEILESGKKLNNRYKNKKEENSEEKYYKLPTFGQKEKSSNDEQIDLKKEQEEKYRPAPCTEPFNYDSLHNQTGSTNPMDMLISPENKIGKKQDEQQNSDQSQYNNSFKRNIRKKYLKNIDSYDDNDSFIEKRKYVHRSGSQSPSVSKEELRNSLKSIRTSTQIENAMNEAKKIRAEDDLNRFIKKSINYESSNKLVSTPSKYDSSGAFSFKKMSSKENSSPRKIINKSGKKENSPLPSKSSRNYNDNFSKPDLTNEAKDILNVLENALQK